MKCRRHRRCRLNPWVGKILWRRTWQPTPVFFPGKSHGERSLVGCSPQSHRELDITEQLSNPIQIDFVQLTFSFLFVSRYLISFFNFLIDPLVFKQCIIQSPCNLFFLVSFPVVDFQFHALWSVKMLEIISILKFIRFINNKG